MPLSTTEKTTLQTTIGDLQAQIDALTPDPVTDPLQVALDAANAQIATLQTQLTTANDANAALTVKIDAAKAHIASSNLADADADAKRAQALADLA